MKKIFSLLMAIMLCGMFGTTTAATAVLSEGFESNDLSTNGWTKQSCHSKTGITNDAKKSGSRSFYFYYNSNPPQYLISKKLSLPDGASAVHVSLYYQAKNSSYAETFQVGYSTTTNEVTGENVFTWDTEISASNTTWEKYVNSINFPGETKYIAIRYNSNNKYYLYIDDIEVTCDISIDGPAMSVMDGETLLSTGHSYDFGLATAGTTKTFTLKNDGSEAAPVTVEHTGDFGVELSANSIPAGESITLTVTMPVTSSEDEITLSSTSDAIADFVLNVSGTVRDPKKLYETLLGGALPEDWTTSGTWTWNTTTGATNTTWYESSNYRLITPQLIVAEGESFFFEAKGNYTGYHGVKLEYSADGSTWTASNTATALTTDWQTFEIKDIPAGNYYIAIHGWYMSVRNYYGGTLPAKVKNVAASNITANGATIGWDAHSSETAWQVSYSTTSGNPANGTIVDANATSIDLTDLKPATTYYVSVRIGENGLWSNETSFTTACGVETAPVKWNFENQTADALPKCWDNSGSESASLSSDPTYIWGVYTASGNKVLRMNNWYVKEGSAFINTPSIKLPATPASELTFDYSHKASCGAFLVKVSADGGENWDELGSYTNETGGNSTSIGDLIEATISLSEYAGKTIILQFSATADYDKGAIFVDNVDIHNASSCAKPTGLAVSDVKATGATFAWTAEAESFKFEYKADGAAEWTSVVPDANPFTLNNLSANTAYEARIKAVCDGGVESEWVDFAAFRTECEATSVSESTAWEEGFEYQAADALPSCWGVPVANDNYDYAKVVESNAKTGSKCLDIKVNNFGTKIVLLPEFTEEAKYLKISFDYNNVSTSSSYGKLEVGYYSDGTFTNVTTLSNVDSYAASGVIEMPKTAPAGSRVAFRIAGVKSNTNSHAYIDNLSVIRKAVCPLPTELAVDPASNGAVVTWTPGDEESAWNIRYREVAEQEANWTVKPVQENEVTLTDLTAGKNYEVQVQATCDQEHSSAWTASVNFTTECPVPANLKVESVEANAAVVTWESAEETFNLQYRPTNEDIIWTTVENIAAKSYELTNLTGNTTYEVRVQAACDGNYTETIELTTKCDARGVNELPLYEDFEQVAENALPECWEKVSETEYPYVVEGVASYGETGRSLWFYGNNEQIVILPAYDADLKGLTFSLFYKVSFASLQLGYLTSLAAEFQVLETLEALSAYGSTEHALDLKNIAADAKYLAIRYCDATSSLASAFVDNVRLAVTPEAPSAIDYNSINATATKRIINGQLIIERDGETYNAQGVNIR